MTRAVVDTNVFCSAAMRGGAPGAVVQLWRAGRFCLCVSRPIMAEYREVLLDKRQPAMLAEIELAVEHERGVFCATSVPALPGVVRDATDVKFVECAVALNADFIVSGDKDLRELKQWGKTRILTPRNFLQELDARR